MLLRLYRMKIRKTGIVNNNISRDEQYCYGLKLNLLVLLQQVLNAVIA
jgi:hypothetical protein